MDKSPRQAKLAEKIQAMSPSSDLAGLLNTQEPLDFNTACNLLNFSTDDGEQRPEGTMTHDGNCQHNPKGTTAYDSNDGLESTTTYDGDGPEITTTQDVAWIGLAPNPGDEICQTYAQYSSSNSTEIFPDTCFYSGEPLLDPSYNYTSNYCGFPELGVVSIDNLDPKGHPKTTGSEELTDSNNSLHLQRYLQVLDQFWSPEESTLFTTPKSSLKSAVREPPVINSLQQAATPPYQGPSNNGRLTSDVKLPPPPSRENKLDSSDLRLPLPPSRGRKPGTSDDGISSTPSHEPKPKKRTPNGRQSNMEKLDPTKYYERLPRAPDSWGKTSDCGEKMFQYNERGELTTTSKFNADLITEYLYNNPAHFDENGNYRPGTGKLTLWIQTTPADSGRRYPNNNSDKCRFAECPVPQKSIRKGFFRVAFDEHAKSKLRIDPYYCAGFVHLYCLERFCRFQEICKDMNVEADDRNLPEGKNKMAITRDHRAMLDVVKTYISSPPAMESFEYEKTLCYQLTSKHLELEPKIRQSTREARGGNHIGLHKGDLEKFARGEVEKNKQRARRASYRRWSDDEEAEEHANMDGEVNYGPRSIKRAKRTEHPPETRNTTPKRKRPKGEEEEEYADTNGGVSHEQRPIKRAKRTGYTPEAQITTLKREDDFGH